MTIYRQQAIHMIVDLINEALNGDGFPNADWTPDEWQEIFTEIEDITMELLDTLPMPKPINIPPYDDTPTPLPDAG